MNFIFLEDFGSHTIAPLLVHMEVLQRKGERFAHLCDITQSFPAHHYQSQPQHPTILIFMILILAMVTMECNDSWL